MRRYLVLILALVVGAAVLIASAPVEAGQRRVALGVWVPEGNRDFSEYQAFADKVGRKPAIWTMSVQWGNKDSKKFPTWYAKQAKQNGSAVMITWTPTKNPMAQETGRYARFKRIAAGKHNTYIKSFCRDAKRFGGPVLLRFAHEINASFFPWTEGWGKFYDPKTGKRTVKNDNSPYQYKRAWKKVYSLCHDKVGATNVKFVWTTAKETCPGCNPYKKWYPGDRYVDYVGFSNFNWGGFADRPFASFDQGLKIPINKFSQFTKKPMIIAELGTTDKVSPEGEDKSDWLRAGYPAVYKKYPRVKAVIYQEVDNTDKDHEHPTWGLMSPEGAYDAYADVAAQYRFKGKVNKKGKVY